MAKMYPKVFPADNPSKAERKVFEYFDKEAPADWRVLHSFRLPKHLKVVFGESDFIVIAPNLGIFILEIKGGGVGFDGQYWQFINSKHEITKKQRGPFEQARQGMFEVERIITDRLGDAYSRNKILYGYGVIFTDEDRFPTDCIVEDEPWRLIQNNVPANYTSFIKRLESEFRRELRELGHRQPGTFDKQEADTIASALRPAVECVAPLRNFLEHSEEDIITLTEQQFGCLVDIEMNDRVVVQGGAGTGKTVIAMEDARREVSQGKKVGVFCFNRNLARVLRQSADDNIEVNSFHSYLARLCKGKYDEKSEKSDDFYKQTLPSLACEVLKELGFDKFDKIIVDEFQDLCVPEYLDCFELMLKGGLFDGNFTFYGDFSRQAIYDKSADLNILKDRTYFSNKMLTVNCRNTKNIGNELINVTGYEDDYYILSIDGELVDYHSWEDRESELQLLKQVMSELHAKKIGSENIVVLSPRTRENSVVSLYDKGKNIIGDYGDDPKSYYARFSTIQAFKGLESKVIVLTDIESYDDIQLLYVAFSRARSKMIVLESKTAAKQRKILTIKRV